MRAFASGRSRLRGHEERSHALFSSVSRAGSLFLLVGVLLAPAAEADVSLGKISDKLSLRASLRTRAEAWNWFEPSSGADNDYLFGATLARGALAWTDERFDVFAEAQNSALFA
ncbi:MAG: hypothetical protein ACREQY_04960, partial [Candidatus Binatia bacterium]